MRNFVGTSNKINLYFNYSYTNESLNSSKNPLVWTVTIKKYAKLIL